MPREWTIENIRDLVETKFQKRACWLQIKIALALHAGKDVVACAPTGAGKTLSFWIALLMALADGEDKMIFVVTPLNLLGKQNVGSLEKAGLSSIAVSKENANSTTFKAIEAGIYRVVVINPEILMGHNHVTKMWDKPHVTKRILYFTFDEGHCISQWASFRKEYLNVGQLRYLIPETIPFYVASATLPPAVLQDVVEILRLRPDQTEHIILSNDRPEIRLLVQGLTFPVTSYRDLRFLIPKDHKEGDPSIPKFLVFFDNTKETEAACHYLRSLLSISLRHKIKYFHSTMTQAYREEEFAEMRDGNVWGLCCTDAFGMGMDLPDIKIVVQYKATCDLCTLWQRFGRVARGHKQEGIAILLVEKKDTEEERAAAVKRKEEKNREGTRTKRKANKQEIMDPRKRIALNDRDLNYTEGVQVKGTDVDEPAASDDTTEDLELERYKSERRAYYCRTARKENILASKGKGRAGVEIGGPMDDFINVDSSVHCRRTVPSIYFGNDRTPVNYHYLCDPNSPSGCSRCAPKVSLVCCDLCHPDVFKEYHLIFERGTRGPAKSSIKAFPMTTTDIDLKLALFTWRREHAIEKFGVAGVRTLGAKLLISDEIIERLVLCAHAQKLSTVPQLMKETSWNKDWATELGPSLLLEISKFFPQLPPAAPTLQAAIETQNSDVGGTVSKRRILKCGKCKQEGHISSNSICPVRQAEKANARHAALHRNRTDENTSPATVQTCMQSPRPRPRPLHHPAQQCAAPLQPSATSSSQLPTLPSTRVQSPPLPPSKTAQTPATSAQPVTPAQPLPLPNIYQHLLNPSFLTSPTTHTGTHSTYRPPDLWRR